MYYHISKIDLGKAPILKARLPESANIKVDRRYPSTQICSACGTRSPKRIKLGIDKWTCVHCGVYHDRDENAAQNLRSAVFLNEGNIKQINPSVTILATKVAKAKAKESKKTKTKAVTAILQ